MTAKSGDGTGPQLGALDIVPAMSVEDPVAADFFADPAAPLPVSAASQAAIALGARLIGCPIYYAREGESFPRPMTGGQRFVSFVDETILHDQQGRRIGRLRAVAYRDRPPLKEAERAIVAEVGAIITAEHEAGVAVGHLDDETLLPNRRAFLADVTALAEARPGSQRFVVLFTVTGIQQYMEVMRALGHGFAEAFAQAAAKRIQQLLGTATSVYSINTLSFGFVLSDETEMPIDRLEAITAAFRKPVICRGIPIYVDAAIGYADLPSPSEAPEALQAAQLAVQEARRQGESWIFQRLKPESDKKRAATILSELNKALASQGQLQLVYQPRVDLQTGKILAAEALIRWEHPVMGKIPPSEFIPLAEATALMTPLTQWILDAAIRQSAEWIKIGIHIRLAVNISPANLRRADFADNLLKMLRLYGVPPKSLEIEITEDTAARAETTVIRQLEQCRNGGITVSIDDFGTGFTNLAKLISLPASLIKIDRSFIDKIDVDERYRTLVKSIIDMSHDLGFGVVAEGIETQSAFKLLKSWNCDAGQGYLIARPAAHAEFERWARSHREN